MLTPGRLARRSIAPLVALAALAAATACRRAPVTRQEPPPPTSSAAAAAAPPGPRSAEPSTVDPAPPGYFRARVFRVVSTSQGDIVLLSDPEGARFLPIFIGGTEALSIRLRTEKQRYPRPLTHDLLDTLVDKLGGRIEKVHVDDIKNKVFIGRVFVRQGDRTFDVDARPSDAIALAVGGGIPVYAASAVFDAAAVPARELGLEPDQDGLRVPARSRPDEPMQL